MTVFMVHGSEVSPKTCCDVLCYINVLPWESIVKLAATMYEKNKIVLYLVLSSSGHVHDLLEPSCIGEC